MNERAAHVRIIVGIVIHTLHLIQPFDGKDQTCHNKRWENWCNYAMKSIGNFSNSIEVVYIIYISISITLKTWLTE